MDWESYSSGNWDDFCGTDGSSLVVHGTIGICFREFAIIAPISYVVLFFFIRRWYLIRRSPPTKTKPLRMHQTAWHYVKALLVILVVLGYAGIISLDIYEDGLAQPKGSILAVALAGFAWLMALLIISVEYKYYRPHGASIRVFFLTTLIGNLFRDGLLLHWYFTNPAIWRNSWTLFQVVCFLNLALCVMMFLGFSENFQRNWEPSCESYVLEHKKGDFGWGDLVSLCKDSWYLWALSFLFSIGEGVNTTLAWSSISGMLAAVLAVDTSNFNQTLGEFTGYALGAALSSFLNKSLAGIAGYRLISSLRRRIYGKLLLHNIPFFDENPPGALFSYLTGDTEKVGLIRLVLPRVFVPLSGVISGFIVLLNTSWPLATVILLLLAMEGRLTSMRTEFISRKYATAYSNENAKITAQASEVIPNVMTVRLFGKQEAETKSFRKVVVGAEKIGFRRAVIEAIFSGFETLTYCVIVVVCLIFSLQLFKAGSLQADGLSAFILVGINIITQFHGIIQILPDVANSTGPAAAVKRILDIDPAIDIYKGESANISNGEIVFKKVNFQYPNTLEPQFSGLDLIISAGTSIGFVGPSGCGKSTLFKLILRFYDVNSGAVLVDGTDLRQFSLKSWLENIAVVTQEPVLFTGTVKQNILYGRDGDVPEEDLIQAVREANLNNVPLDTQVGERGMNLSGGQRQRVCIARALIRKPKILLLDEVTSALDPISEAEVMAAVNNLMTKRKMTTLFIAHRLHTITNVDKIVVMRKGKIEAVGPHDELLKTCDFYKDMFNKQQKLAQSPVRHNLKWGIHDKNAVVNLLDALENSLGEMPLQIKRLVTQLRQKQDDDDDTHNEFKTYTGLQTLSGAKTTTGMRKRTNTEKQGEEQNDNNMNKVGSVIYDSNNNEDIPLKSKSKDNK